MIQRAIDDLKDETEGSSSSRTSDIDDVESLGSEVSEGSEDALKELQEAGIAIPAGMAMIPAVGVPQGTPVNGEMALLQGFKPHDFVFNQCMVMLGCLGIGAVLVPIFCW